jgi:hypothetical protein
MENCDATTLRMQERSALVPAARATRNPAPAAERNEANKHAPEQLLTVKLRPIAAEGREVKTGAPADATMVPTLWRWCPLHETSLHDITACRHLNGMVEIRKRGLT